MASHLRPFFGYYGGKWRDAPRYPPPEHGIIIEPFAGSAGYSLRVGADRDVVLYESDPILVAVWEYLIHVEPDEILAIPDVPNDGRVADLDIPQAAKHLVGFWMNRGVATPRPAPGKWMRSGIRPGSFWGERARKTIAAQVPMIRKWQIHAGGYEAAPADLEATWFIDPPYQAAGRHYRHGSKGIDFTMLGKWCRSRKGQVIVCENEGATWLPFRELAKTKTTRKEKPSHEVHWLSSFGENGAASTPPEQQLEAYEPTT